MHYSIMIDTAHQFEIFISFFSFPFPFFLSFFSHFFLCFSPPNDHSFYAFWIFLNFFFNLSLFLSISLYFFFFSALTKLNVQDEITEKKQEKTNIDTNNVSISDTKTGVKGTASGMPNKSPEIHKSRALLAATYSKVTASEFEVR